MSDKSLVSNAFQTFMSEAPEHAQACGGLIQGLSSVSALDKKTQALAYLSVRALRHAVESVDFRSHLRE